MNLLLDTTIQIDRITGSKERKNAVNKVLKDNKLFCSKYVLGEYYSNIVNNLITLYNLFLIDKDIGETGKRINERVFGRDQARVAKLYANILTMCEFDIEEVENTFLLYIDLIQDEFYLDLEEMIDITNCPRAEAKVIFEDICSSNKKDFQPICNAIGLELISPDYSWKNKQ